MFLLNRKTYSLFAILFLFINSLYAVDIDVISEFNEDGTVIQNEINRSMNESLGQKVEDLDDLSVTATSTEINTLDILAAATASRALILNSDSKITSSATTDTELGHVSGVTSAIQTQLNTKVTIAVGGQVIASGIYTYSGGVVAATTITFGYTFGAAPAVFAMGVGLEITNVASVTTSQFSAVGAINNLQKINWIAIGTAP